MQDAKDTFYATLRDRIAANNPARTTVLRNATRPAVLVTENELPAASPDNLPLLETFCLRWLGLSLDTSGPLPLAAMQCEIRYGTDGSTDNAGMDRGRSLSAMDGELAIALTQQPTSAPKLSYIPGVTRSTAIFWGDLNFGPITARSERLERKATVEVYAYQEAGEA